LGSWLLIGRRDCSAWVDRLQSVDGGTGRLISRAAREFSTDEVTRGECRMEGGAERDAPPPARAGSDGRIGWCCASALTKTTGASLVPSGGW